jgi:hypothetical protein
LGANRSSGRSTRFTHRRTATGTRSSWATEAIRRAPGIELEDQDLNRILFIDAGTFGSAGETRNAGLDFLRVNGINTMKWIAFLDDDDHLSPDYVAHLKEHAEDYPWADVVVFRMKHPALGVLPPGNGVLRQGTVGISFAAKSFVMTDRRFVQEDVPNLFHEDWTMIESFIKDGNRIFISNHIDYYVREAKP